MTSREQDSYESFRAYYWQEDRRISANYAIKLREESGDRRIGDCYCHKKCRERGEAAMRFPRKVDHLGKSNHFWKGSGQGNSSRDCEIRTRVRRLKEDSGRNNHYDNFLSDLIFHLTGSGNVLQIFQIGESPIDDYDILSSEVPQVSSSSTPDIILRHGSSTVRDATYVYVVNTSRNRTFYDPPHRTELNTIVIRITNWSSDQIADFATFGTRKFREEWGFLEDRIRKDAEEREAEMIEEVCGYRDRARTLIEKGKMAEEILASWDSGENDQGSKEKFLELLPVIEAGEKELRDEYQKLRMEAAKKAAEEAAKKAAEEAEKKAAEEAAKKAAEEEAKEAALIKQREFEQHLEMIEQRKAEQEIKKEALKEEISRRQTLLDQNRDLSGELNLLIKDDPEYSHREIVAFCKNFPAFQKRFQNKKLRGDIEEYLTGNEIPPEEFLSRVLGTGIFGISEFPELKSFEEINDFLRNEIKSTKEEILSGMLPGYKEEYEELFGMATPENLIENFIESYEVQTRVLIFRGVENHYGKEFLKSFKVTGRSSLEAAIISKRLTLQKEREEAEKRALADRRAKETERLCDSLDSQIERLRKTNHTYLENTLEGMESVSSFARRLIQKRADSAEGSEVEVLTTKLLTARKFVYPMKYFSTHDWEELGGPPPILTSFKLFNNGKLITNGLMSEYLPDFLLSCVKNLQNKSQILTQAKTSNRGKVKNKTNKRKGKKINIPSSIKCPECNYTRTHKQKTLPDCSPCAMKRRKNVRMEWVKR